MSHFARPELARFFSNELERNTVSHPSNHTLFLEAPRGSGKSAFLTHDLAPELEARGALVIHCDLIADQDTDPGRVIYEAVGEELLKQVCAIASAPASANAEVPDTTQWIRINTAMIGAPGGASLSDALKAIRAISRQSLVVIVDDVQHALTTASGEGAMRDLKTALSDMNSGRSSSLKLVTAGSDPYKLVRLLYADSAPFREACLAQLPRLDTGYIKQVKTLAERKGNQALDSDKLSLAFTLFGHQPHLFQSAIAEVCIASPAVAQHREERLLRAALQHIFDTQQSMADTYRALPPLEQAVMWRILDKGACFRPYDDNTLAFFEDKTCTRQGAEQVQRALASLCNRSPALLWRSARGDYVVSNTAMHAWYQDKASSGGWPPRMHAPQERPTVRLAAPTCMKRSKLR